MQQKSMKISENTEFKIDIKTVIGIIMLTTTLVGMYYTLQDDIDLAKRMLPTEVKRLEYDLKEQWNHANIKDLKERVDMIEQMGDILSEEIMVLSTLVKDGTKTDGKLDELAKQVLALKSKKRR